jgi:transcriptional antiterminator RfaH
MEQKRWYCVKTQTKRERLAAEHLRDVEGVEVLCPILRYRKATRRGQVWWQEALFPGYILAQFSLLDSERSVINCHGVRGLVKFGGLIPAVSDWIIEELKKTWEKYSDSEVITVQPQLQEGDEVELAFGPFRGMKGQIVTVIAGSERVKILLEFLGSQQSIDVDLFSILLPRRPLPGVV